MVTFFDALKLFVFFDALKLFVFVPIL